MKYLLLALSVAMVAAFAQVSSDRPLIQQPRYYTIRIPEEKINSFLMVVQGHLNQVSAQDFNELQQSSLDQINFQYRQYVREDSVVKARLNPPAKVDSSKTKKP